MDGWEEWDGLQYGVGDSAVVKRNGDAVFLTPRCRGRPCELGFLMACFSDKQGYKWVSIQWLWRPEMLKRQVDDHMHEDEVFLGSLTQENPYESLEL